MVNGLMTVFDNIQHICCYYHYKDDINKNIKKYNLNKIFGSNEVKNELFRLPFIYRGSIKVYEETLKKLKIKHKHFTIVLYNYFDKYKKYFLSGDYNYCNQIERIRSNSYIETYNKFIKESLGKKRLVNWVIFNNFIKSESDRIKEKLNKIENHNIKFSQKKQNLV